jgi:hypothetical protein
MGIAFAAYAEVVSSRFGKLEIVGEWGESKLLFKGRSLAPPVEGNNFLSFEKKVVLADRDLVVVQDNGGTGCPALLYIIDVSKAGAKTTGAFGSCTDLVQITSIANGVRISMQGFVGPAGSQNDIRKALRKRYVYEYQFGTLRLNGKPIS